MLFVTCSPLGLPGSTGALGRGRTRRRLPGGDGSDAAATQGADRADPAGPAPGCVGRARQRELTAFRRNEVGKAGMEEYAGGPEMAAGAQGSEGSRIAVSSEAEPASAEPFQGKMRDPRGPQTHGVHSQARRDERGARGEALVERDSGAAGGAENSSSCPTGGARGGGRAPRSSAAISCGVVTARVTRMGPQQREQTEMSTRKTRARSVIHGRREGAASRS